MSNIAVDYDVLNQKQTPAFYASSLATRPAAGYVGRIFIDTDTPSSGIYRDTGTAWEQVADSGAGTTGTLQQVTTNGNTTTLGISVQGLTIGKGAGTIASNTAIGNLALNSNTTGSGITAIGSSALQSNTTGQNNIGVGANSLFANTTGGNNTGLGANTLIANTTASFNTAIGSLAMSLNSTGSNNTAVGYNSLLNNTTGGNNTAIGNISLQNNTTGTLNTAIGVQSLAANTTGTGNTAIGSTAGGSITTGSNNTILGNYTGTTTLASNIVLSDGAGNVRLFSDANGLIGINQAVGSTIGGQLDIHTTQTYALVLNGLTTNNAYTAFSNASVGQWRIGNTYNSGANTFDIFNLGTSTSALSFNKTNNYASFTGTIANSITQATITSNSSTDFSTTFTPTTTITNVNSYGLISRYKLNLANGIYNSAGTTNATAIFGFLNIDGNNGTISTQSIRAFTSGLSVSTAAIKLTDYRNFQINSPDSTIVGNTITNGYGLYISPLKGSTNYTITNGWGIYQTGSSDYNYFNGACLIGSNTYNGFALDVTGTAKISGAFTATTANFLNSSGNTQITIGFDSSYSYPMGRNASDGLFYFQVSGAGASGYVFQSPIQISNTITAAIAAPSTHKVSILINGVQYYLLASNV